MNQPVIFPAHQRDWWYCDLVRVVDDGDTVLVDDHWIDVIVGPPDHPYRVLDLDEYADAMAAGDIDPATGVDGLRRTQMFLGQAPQPAARHPAGQLARLPAAGHRDVGRTAVHSRLGSPLAEA